MGTSLRTLADLFVGVPISDSRPSNSAFTHGLIFANESRPRKTLKLEQLTTTPLDASPYSQPFSRRFELTIEITELLYQREEVPLLSRSSPLFSHLLG